MVEIVGLEEPDGVHTIEMWFSTKRGRWIVERHDCHGGIVGHAFHALDEHDAERCLSDWLRAHAETHLVGRHRPDVEATATRRDAA